MTNTDFLHHHEECPTCHTQIHDAVVEAEVDVARYLLGILVHAGVFLSALIFLTILGFSPETINLKAWLQIPVTILATVVAILSFRVLETSIKHRQKLRKERQLSL